MELMSAELQNCTMNAIAHEAYMAGSSVRNAAAMYERPCVLFRPSIFIDGNQWCALYGENLQDGVAGFGDSPDLAMADFDSAWVKKITPHYPGSIAPASQG